METLKNCRSLISSYEALSFVVFYCFLVLFVAVFGKDK